MEKVICAICGEEITHPVWEELFGALYICSKGHSNSRPFGVEIPSICDAPDFRKEKDNG
jgi:hypothetical protein